MTLSDEEANAERTNDGRIRDRSSLNTGVLREDLGLKTDSEDSNSRSIKCDIGYSLFGCARGFRPFCRSGPSLATDVTWERSPRRAPRSQSSSTLSSVSSVHSAFISNSSCLRDRFFIAVHFYGFASRHDLDAAAEHFLQSRGLPVSIAEIVQEALRQPKSADNKDAEAVAVTEVSGVPIHCVPCHEIRWCGASGFEPAQGGVRRYRWPYLITRFTGCGWRDSNPRPSVP